MIFLEDTDIDTVNTTSTHFEKLEGPFFQITHNTAYTRATYTIKRALIIKKSLEEKKVDKRPFHIRMKDHPSSRKHK
ncbi:hypothetical protein EVB32_048 [Rhizobium phage RHph_TM39]|uniref:Uncharacterized protein n=2 Tax=Cuauhnahuacvirus TaxID=3044696 RepID=A0A7S5RGU9_9CAUD|nr:hypothetical protein PQC16_gp048 [Rhizobium phage RHph_TM30]YP_010671195.1 hypothetical protein PQC17_gp046 [Rhizobium phage RHph_Y65]QIG77036.1 hypothetical protein EVB32_048 [Rhizobium phage RHph_TM39]QIG77635.1 hypothetical protein EVB64_048 [Rhizobium phage RHph_TM61]QIG71155.1 hypothetical protein EVB93_048 [Rhizobium phage RHph_TM30]QIG72604.1 hypothetical protein EVB97_046 [Rhizobium phage RHph_Y65]